MQLKDNPVLKCAHCQKIITSSYYKIFYNQDGDVRYYCRDPIMGSDCVTAAGINHGMTRYPSNQPIRQS
jgi:hypothetical protein